MVRMVFRIVLVGFFVMPGFVYAQSVCGPNGCVLKSPKKLGQTIDESGFNLAPGEILVSVDGTPVNQLIDRSFRFPVMNTITKIPVNIASKLVVNRDNRAYQHALREAQIIASRGSGYNRASDGGHPLGVAPGCRFAGTGFSRDPNRPNHCYLGEIEESRLVARAMVPGPNGTYFWSAHYR